IENCIDHTRDMDAVMRELVRVLTPTGVLYLTVNCRTKFGYYVHRALSSSGIDAAHPHTFTPPRARALCERYGFTIKSCVVGSYLKGLRDDLHGPGMKSRMKAALGVSEFLASVIAQRAPATG